ncbi:MAG: hypothetical protein O9290_18595, partial [Microcystis sp. LE19-41.2A]|uniref:hypothetical protein n=1 Tax=Microcystis sp. LE19-41.2A TaxID=3016427 RepID=UPI0022C43910
PNLLCVGENNFSKGVFLFVSFFGKMVLVFWMWVCGVVGMWGCGVVGGRINNSNLLNSEVRIETYEF